MECCICSPVCMFRPPRNAICAACYEGAKTLQTILNDSEAKPGSKKTLLSVWQCVTAMGESAGELKERIEFLSGFVGGFRDQIHTDIILNSGDNGTPQHAHKALMATRSEVFKNMLDSDTCKSATAEPVTLPDLSSIELNAFLEFLYTGSLSDELMTRHVYALSVAADKYDVRFLRRSCERHMSSALSVSTALDVLGIADTCSYQALKDVAVKFIVENMQQIVFSPEYEAFALKNPHLCVLVARASFKVQNQGYQYSDD